MVLPLYCLRVALARLVFIRALIMASATPVSSEGGTSVSIRAARGVRGFQHDAESPHVADAVIEAFIRIERTRVRAPIVRRIPRDAKRFQQSLELEKHLIFAAPQDVRQYLTTAVIYRVPEPPRLAFLAHVGLHLIDFCFLRSLDHHVHLVRMQRVEQRSVHRGERRLFFFNALMTVVGLIFNTRAVSRIPLPLRRMSTICSWIAGARPL